MNTSLPLNEGHPAATAASRALPSAGQYLIFYLGREEYGIEALRVREIIGQAPLQAAPGLPFCVRGVVHILGKTIPVIDLRLKLGLVEPSPGNRALKKDPDSTWTPAEAPGPADSPDQYPEGCIVMIDTGENRSGPGPAEREKRGGTRLGRHFEDPALEFSCTGIAVDCVSELVHIRPEDIEPAASAAGRPAPGCILGLIRIGRRTRTLLDIDLALSLDARPEQALSRTLPSPG